MTNKRLALVETFSFRGQAYACTRQVKARLEAELGYILSLSKHGMRQEAYGAAWGLQCSMASYAAAGQLKPYFSSAVELEATGS